VSTETNWAFGSVICACVVLANASCTYSRPPQTGFYCVDFPKGSAADASRFIQLTAQRLGFKVSEAQFAADHGPPNHSWEVYGRGVSLFVDTAMKGSGLQTTFNPNRLSLQVVKTGLWQRIGFAEALAAPVNVARELGLSVTRAPGGNCST
jgi:predicted dehydrogenase